VNTASRRWVVASLAASVVATLTAAAGGFDFPPLVRTALVLVALGPLAAIASDQPLREALTMRAAVIAAVALNAGAVLLPSHESHDLWSYAVDGRIMSHYGESPYVHAPAHYPHDVFLHLVGSGWRHTRSVYGPLFTWIAAGITAVTGPHELPTRLAFQLLAAAAVLTATWLVARITHDPLAVVFIAVNPIVALEVVNPGRNDALVGLALLGAVLLARRRAFVIAAVVATLAVLVKAVALLALGALVLWIVRRGGARAAARAGAGAAAMLVVPYVLAGGVRALRPLASASDRLSRASVWQVARRDGIEHLLGVDAAEPARRVVQVVGPVALVVVAVLALVWVLSRLHDPTPELVVVAGIGAFLFVGSYVLASYIMWILPLIAWRHRAGISRALLAWSALLLLAYQAARGMPSTAEDAAAWLGSLATVAVALVSIVGLSMVAVRRLRAQTPAASPPVLPKLGA
jgi:hypothetical protein